MTSSGLSTAVQEKTIGEGLAIGCLGLGVVAVLSDKMRVEFAFSRAWRSWRFATTFPQVHVSIQRNDILRILHRSEGRRGPLAAWRCGTYLEPFIWIDGWDTADVSEILLSACGVPEAGWNDLATAFVADMGDDLVVRSASD